MPKGKPRNGNRLRRGEKAAIIAASTLTPSPLKLARQFGVAPNTVRAILKDPNYSALSNEEYSEAAKILAAMSLGTSLRAEKSITDEKLSSSSAVQLKVVAKIGVEMANLLTDRPTAIHRHNDVTDLAATTLDKLKKSFDVIEAETLPESPDSSLLNDSSPSDKPGENA